MFYVSKNNRVATDSEKLTTVQRATKNPGFELEILTILSVNAVS